MPLSRARYCYHSPVCVSTWEKIGDVQKSQKQLVFGSFAQALVQKNGRFQPACGDHPRSAGELHARVTPVGMGFHGSVLPGLSAWTKDRRGLANGCGGWSALAALGTAASIEDFQAQFLAKDFRAELSGEAAWRERVCLRDEPSQSAQSACGAYR